MESHGRQNGSASLCGSPASLIAPHLSPLIMISSKGAPFLAVPPFSTSQELENNSLGLGGSRASRKQKFLGAGTVSLSDLYFEGLVQHLPHSRHFAIS